jgi:Glycosyltransferase
MPIRNGLFEKGKCGYKLIQYMACGKSIVASPVGVNEKIVKESNAGYLASNVEDWSKYLALLCESKTLRDKYGYAARMYIEKEYSFQTRLPILANIILKLNQDNA